METMNSTGRKRLRSDEGSPSWSLQNKKLINQKIINSIDSAKMKAVHERTIRQLFEAAQKLSQKSVGNSKQEPIWRQLILNGDGSIHFYQTSDFEPIDFPVEKRKAECCGNRQIYIQEPCNNCNFTLCEECGYSCGDCGIFLCRSCVTLFGCGTSERPICEKCSIFN